MRPPAIGFNLMVYAIRKEANMASIHREVELTTSADGIWQKLEDPAEINKWFTFLGPVTWDEETSRRSCAFGEATLDELVLDVDPARRRVAYAITGGSPIELTFHSASMQVVDREGGSTFIWTTDFKPDDAQPGLEEAIDGAVATITASDG